jgi:hypothetical protein
LLELVAELGGTTTEELELEALDPGATEELDPKLLFPSTLELLPTNQSRLDEEAAVDGVNGEGTSSEQALNIETAPTASKELNKTFFIIFLFTPSTKIRFYYGKRHEKKFFESDNVTNGICNLQQKKAAQ